MTSIADAVEALSLTLRTDLARIAAKITAAETDLIQAWPTASVRNRRRLMATLQARIAALSVAAAEIARVQVSGVVGSAYKLGGQGVATTAATTARFDGTDLAAIAVQAQDTYSDVLLATQHVRQTTKDLIRLLAKQHISDKLVSGVPPATASKALATELAQNTITAITYSNGARHDLGDYTDMLVRTKTAEAHQLGGFSQARSIGIEYMEIMDGPGCGWTSHQDPLKANGLILPVDEAAQYPLSHPRCRRVASARPDLTSKAEADSATPIGPQFSAEDIARAHLDSSVSSKAIQQARATVVKRKSNGALLPDTVPKAVRTHRAAVAKRLTSPPKQG